MITVGSEQWHVFFWLWIIDRMYYCYDSSDQCLQPLKALCLKCTNHVYFETETLSGIRQFDTCNIKYLNKITFLLPFVEIIVLTKRMLAKKDSFIQQGLWAKSCRWSARYLSWSLYLSWQSLSISWPASIVIDKN